MDKILTKLIEKFNYCDKIGFYPFPSITPTQLEGYLVHCEFYDKPIDQCDCINCEYYKKEITND